MASDTRFLKYWQYTWQYYKSIADTSDTDTCIAILTTLQKSAAKFDYIKTPSVKVVAQSIAFRVVSIYWQGVAPFP